MSPNSRYDRLDKFERRSTSTKQSVAKSDSPSGKNCKFGNVQSNEHCDTVAGEHQDFTQQADDLKSCKFKSVERSIGLKNCKFKEFKEFNDPAPRRPSCSKQYELKMTISQKTSNFKFKFPTIPACRFKMSKSFTSTCSSASNAPIHIHVLISYVFVTLISVLIYLPCIYNEFVFDDKPAIVHNKIVQEVTPFTNVHQLFTTDYWGTPIQKVSGLFFFLIFLQSS